jgi:hypothetical protein
MGTSSRVHTPIRKRSLYWRIVLGFGACIAGVLAVQTTAVLLMLRSVPDGPRLNAFTHSVATDLGEALEAHPDLDVQPWIDSHYPKPIASLFIDIARHNQVVLRGPARPPAPAIAGAREFWAASPALPENWMTGPLHVTPIMVRGRLAGGGESSCRSRGGSSLAGRWRSWPACCCCSERGSPGGSSSAACAGA